jgi:hypothetical protein
MSQQTGSEKSKPRKVRFFDLLWSAQRMASRSSQKERIKMKELHDLEKSRTKLKNALDRDPNAGRVTISKRLAESISEHLYRLADLES